MSQHVNSRLGQILINKGLISTAQLDAAIKVQLTSHKRLGEVLIDSGMLDDRDLGRLLAGQKGLPFLDLAQMEIEPKATGRIGSATCRHSFSSAPFRVRMYASHTTSASLTSSEGCRLSPPMLSQFVLPP